MRPRAAGAQAARGASAPPPPASLSIVEEEHAIDILSAVAILDDRQLAALVGSKRAAALRAIQRDVLHG